MPHANRELILKKLEKADRLPSLPAAVGPLLEYLRQPIESLQLNEVARLIARDKSLTAQCLHLANSPLFGVRGSVDTVRGAVLNLGMRRMQEIATSCCLINLTPRNCSLNPTVFWEHALGVALAGRYFAQAVAFPDPDKAYLAGLLHDFGIVMNLWVAPKEFAQALTNATSRHVPLAEAELEVLGISHTEVGRLLGEKWHMPPDLIQVIAFHHDVEQATEHRGLVALVSLVDLLCRMSAIGYGYPENRQIDFLEQPAFHLLIAQCPNLSKFDWERFTFEMDTYLIEVQRLVSLVYRRS